MPWHNKVLRNIEIFDFVIFREVLIIHCSPDLTRTLSNIGERKHIKSVSYDDHLRELSTVLPDYV